MPRRQSGKTFADHGDGFDLILARLIGSDQSLLKGFHSAGQPADFVFAAFGGNCRLKIAGSEFAHSLCHGRKRCNELAHRPPAAARQDQKNEAGDRPDQGREHRVLARGHRYDLIVLGVGQGYDLVDDIAVRDIVLRNLFVSGLRGGRICAFQRRKELRFRERPELRDLSIRIRGQEPLERAVDRPARPITAAVIIVGVQLLQAVNMCLQVF